MSRTLRSIFFVVLLLVLSGSVSAQDADGGGKLCGTLSGAASSRSLDGTGGIYMTSRGTLRVLIVFASFPDDETPHPYWPAHGPPLFMQQFIDPDTTSNSQASYNLTNYFHQMSLGQFHVVGEAVWVEMTHSQLEYWNNGFGRANLNALQERVDPLVDFSMYDGWTKEANYTHTNVPDGQVDMIIMVWRTTMWEFLGEASLGYKPGFLADGKRIEMGFPERIAFPLGSGVTCKYPYNDRPYQAMQTMAHELGHWLLGGPHPYSTTIFGKHAYWGLLCNGQRVASCANAYERERLGWIDVPEIQPDSNLTFTDYLSTGVAYKYHPANGYPFEYFYMENHQRLSVFDDVTANSADKGIWVLHQKGPYMEMDDLRIRPSDGNWNWENPGVTTQCFSQGLPVFKRGVPKTLTGESHRDQIPTPTSLVNWMFVFKNPEGELNCGAFFRGERFVGAFSADVSPVFSPYSNPNSNTWDNQATPFSFEIVDEIDGVVTVRYNSNQLDAAPARRYLGRDPTVQDTLSGWISLAWGAQWPEGQNLEADVNWSELQRQIGDNGVWITMYVGQATQWRDGSIAYDTSGAIPVLFRSRVRDAQGKYSAWSNIHRTTMVNPNGTEEQRNEVSNRYSLEPNYPNPFNPSTKIVYRVPSLAAGQAGQEFVELRVFDVLGREVATLVDGVKEPGEYSVAFDATGLASGVYFYRLTAGGFTTTRRMIVVK